MGWWKSLSSIASLCGSQNQVPSAAIRMLLPSNSFPTVPGLMRSEVQVMNMDLAGIMVSAGSACSSGKVKASRVVEAMGRADLAPFALRISGGWASTEDDWIKCGDAWLAAWKRIGARRREVA